MQLFLVLNQLYRHGCCTLTFNQEDEFAPPDTMVVPFAESALEFALLLARFMLGRSELIFTFLRQSCRALITRTTFSPPPSQIFLLMLLCGASSSNLSVLVSTFLFYSKTSHSSRAVISVRMSMVPKIIKW